MRDAGAEGSGAYRSRTACAELIAGTLAIIRARGAIRSRALLLAAAAGSWGGPRVVAVCGARGRG